MTSQRKCEDIDGVVKTGSYATGAIARRELDKIRRRRPRRGEVIPTRVYPCQRCGRFHLTSQDY